MDTKKLGFGLMRLPSLDPNDPGKIDMEQTCRMTDTFIDNGFTYCKSSSKIIQYTKQK